MTVSSLRWRVIDFKKVCDLRSRKSRKKKVVSDQTWFHQISLVWLTGYWLYGFAVWSWAARGSQNRLKGYSAFCSVQFQSRGKMRCPGKKAHMFSQVFRVFYTWINNPSTYISRFRKFSELAIKRSWAKRARGLWRLRVSAWLPVFTSLNVSTPYYVRQVF